MSAQLVSPDRPFDLELVLEFSDTRTIFFGHAASIAQVRPELPQPRAESG